MLLFLTGCFLFTDELYDTRLAELASADQAIDADGDGWSPLEGDCDDDDVTAYPDATEVCDHVDNDCDLLTDEDPAPNERFPDTDGDGYGNERTGSYACFPGDDWIEVGEDCNDSNPDMNPSAAEACNDVDDDCNGVPDDGIEWNFWFLDSDGDGWGDDDSSLSACAAPAESWVLVGDDCDDDEAGVNPGATEVCDDGVDNDCDATRECGWVGEVDLEVESHGRVLGDVRSQALGAAISSLGDIDGDGVEDFTVYGESDSASYLYIFRGGIAGDRAPETASVGFVGASTLLVGAAYSEELASYLVADVGYDYYRGAVFSYPVATSGIIDPTGATPHWTGTAGSDETFGEELQVSRALYESGVESVLVASPGQSGTSVYQGAVLLLDTAGGEQGSITGTEAFEFFGNTARVVPDLDGDGLDDIAVVGSGESSGGLAVHAFLSPVTGVFARTDADATYMGAEDDRLGLDALSGLDFTGDGHSDLVLGAPRSDFGRVYVVPGPFPNGDATGIHPGDAVNRIAIDEGEVPYFGQSVTTGDFDADGAADLVIGSPYHYNTQQSGGAILLYGPIDAGRTIAYDDISNSRVVHATFEALPGEGAGVGYEVLGLSANGDEYTDLLVNAALADVGGVANAGVTWLILGDGI